MEYNNENDIKFIGDSKYKKIYLNILKAASCYDKSELEPIKYDYSYNKNDIDLVKEKFDLAALKVESEFQTFVNALNWVSILLKSNKLIQRPMGNATTIISDVTSGKCATNCYGYAIVLNEILCALGYKCKYVFCYPVSFHFLDCHVVNLVFSNEQKNGYYLMRHRMSFLQMRIKMH